MVIRQKIVQTEPILRQSNIDQRSDESSTAFDIRTTDGDCSVSANESQSIEIDESINLVNSDQPQCRICLDVEGEDLIAPCHCRGTQKYVHRSCLDNWRSTKAASNALMARLEAQKALCDSSERDLHRRFIKREELEAQIKPEGGDQARKRSRMDDAAFEEGDDRTALYLPASKPKYGDAFLSKLEDDEKVLALPGTSSRSHLHKELRVFLKEEQKAYEAGLSFNSERKEAETEVKRPEIVEDMSKVDPEVCEKGISITSEDEFKGTIKEDMNNIRFPVKFF